MDADVDAGTDLADASLRHLFGRLAVLERRVRFEIACRRRHDPSPDDPLRGLYLSELDLDRILSDRQPVGVGDEEATAAASRVEREADDWAAVAGPVRLRRLAASFGLSPLDVEILLVALAPDLDRSIEQLYGYLHDDVSRRRASIGLALELARCAPARAGGRARFAPAGALVAGGLLQIEEQDRPFLTRSLRVPDRVTGWLLGDEAVDPSSPGFRADLDGDSWPAAALAADRLVHALRAGVTLSYLRVPAHLDPAAVAAASGRLAGRPALALDLSGRQGPLDQSSASAVRREARLLDRALVIGPVEVLGVDAVRALGAGPGPTVLFGATAWDASWSEHAALSLNLEVMHGDTQRSLWRAALVAAGQPALAGAVDRSGGPGALGSYRLGAAPVRRAVEAALSAAAADAATVDLEHLVAGARTQNGTGLEALARRVEPVAGWGDLVLGEDASAALRHLVSRVANRSCVLDEWGLRRGGGRGEAVIALFAGESGTGKTLAAEVVAGELGLDLYVIDLSRVVDKYIGETEKNLERVFTEAEEVNGVLFFDEADALFGKRSKVTDARDRYANLEVAYLLQRMERFDGLAILATNLRANLDEAFARRLSVAVEFAAPDGDARLALWARSLRGVPLGDDADLTVCADRFELAGGSIRSVATTAAYLAASNGQLVHMPDLLRAVQWEYRKMGRLCPDAEFGTTPWLGAGR